MVELTLVIGTVNKDKTPPRRPARGFLVGKSNYSIKPGCRIMPWNRSNTRTRPRKLACQAVILGRQIGVIGMGTCIRCMVQSHLQRMIARAGFAGTALTRASVIPRSCACPKCQVIAEGKQLIPVPISAIIISVVWQATPGMVAGNSTTSSKGWQYASICSSKRAIVSSNNSVKTKR